MRRSFLLVEVLAALALLALVGVMLIRIQSASIRQTRMTAERSAVAEDVRALLWNWSTTNERVTLPAHGKLSGGCAWERLSEPVRVPGNVSATLVSLIVRDAGSSGPTEVYRVEWLVPQREQR